LSVITASQCGGYERTERADQILYNYISINNTNNKVKYISREKI